MQDTRDNVVSLDAQLMSGVTTYVINQQLKS
jgi:hypothetical protein